MRREIAQASYKALQLQAKRDLMILRNLRPPSLLLHRLIYTSSRLSHPRFIIFFERRGRQGCTFISLSCCTRFCSLFKVDHLL